MATFNIVDVITQHHSDETNQDSEPSIAVNSANPDQIIVSAFTPPDDGFSTGPLFVSVDGGATWNMSYVAPNGMPLDQTYKFDTQSDELFGGTIDATSDPFANSILLDELRTDDPFNNATMPILESPQPSPTDQPFIAATSVPFGVDVGKSRTYTGYNDLRVSSGTGHTSAVEICLDALAATPVFSTAHIERRATPTVTGGGKQDGPQVRTAAHGDGTIYAVFSGWRSWNLMTDDFTTDVVVVRDDTWATGSDPFSDLVDPGDSVAGFRVQTGVALNWDQQIGQERVAGSLAIAAHPADSDIVYICWAGPETAGYSLHVQRSLNRGVTWSGVLLQVSVATNPALAITTTGRIGFLYQQVTGSGATARWETHFRDSINGTTWSDAILHSAPVNVPGPIGQPYIGDYVDLVAVGKNYYGAFCGNNTPDSANFPTVMATFLRNVDSATHTLRGSDGMTAVNPSIDPFFFKATEVEAAADFFVRDWTDSAASDDTGVEPSTNPNFWTTSDVWNQVSSTTPAPPNANDQPVGENATSGTGSASQNYAFARIRRRALPAAGTGPTTVSAHFLVSEFGTGSNFVDWLFNDPSDPDLSFPTLSDVTVTFADTDLGPLVTPPFEWDLGPTTSDHLCLAVEIYSPGDPFAAPGLTGRAPGTSGATLAVVNDNNKAQRNLQVYAGLSHVRGAMYYGIVHNASTVRRNMVLASFPGEHGAPPKGTEVEIVTAEGATQRRPWAEGQRLTLAGMEPGENRWIGVRVPVAGAATTPAVVPVAEVKGDAVVNGFAIGVRPAPEEAVIDELLGFARRVLLRMDHGFAIPGAARELDQLDTVSTDAEIEEGAEGPLDVDERVRVHSDDITIEIDVRIRAGDRSERRRRHPARRTLSASAYEELLRGSVDRWTALASALGAGTDPFQIQQALGEIRSTAPGDVASLTAAHATALHRFDAFMTMLHKATGDRADLVQMVAWHAELSEQAPALEGLQASADAGAVLRSFLDSVTARTVRLSDYPALLARIAPLLRTIAGELGQTRTLEPLVDAIVSAGTSRGTQRAHRDYLLALAGLV